MRSDAADQTTTQALEELSEGDWAAMELRLVGMRDSFQINLRISPLEPSKIDTKILYL